MIHGVIFDMDGVLVDTEEHICQAAIRFFGEQGIQAKEDDFLPFVGAGENRYIGGVAEQYGLNVDIEDAKKRTYEIYHEIVRNKLTPLPGVYEFIESCKQRRLRLALATSADSPKMVINLQELGLKQETFDRIITGNDVVHKKPHPEIFIKAAELLELPPETCLVVEDSVNGIKAAKSAGCKCLGLTTSFGRSQLSEADWIVKDLSEAPLDVIKW